MELKPAVVLEIFDKDFYGLAPYGGSEVRHI